MYKIKTFLPLKARLQIFHSFVQSHINYCSLVWGFSAKSNIESIFACQKKGLRAVVPGFVNYFYKDGKLPAHTKSSFNKFKILTIHNIIIKNTIVAMYKITNLPDLIPKSVGATISPNAPTCGSNHETCEDWLNVYGSPVFRKSFFFKGPLVFSDPSTHTLETPAALRSNDAYKHSVKRFMLAAQGEGEEDEWHNENFTLYNIQGLRKSVRLQNQ
jgi:hypothetical protein